MSGRTKMVGAVFLVFGIFWWPTVGTAGPVTFWTTSFDEEGEGFPPEATASGNWSVITSAQAAHSGSRGLDITGPTATGGDVLTFDLSSVGFTAIGLDYWTKIRAGLEADDSVLIEWSPDAGVTWFVLDTRTDVLAGDWVFSSFVLPVEANNNSNLMLRLDAELGSTGDRFGADDFALMGTPIPEPASFAMLAFGSVVGFHRRLRRHFS